MGNNHNKGYFLGINEGHVDPSVAIIQKGKVLAFAEEERFVRYKHAPNIYPINALKYCLKVANVSMEEITSVGINWNLTAYTDGTMQRFFEDLGKKWDVDEKTLAWQGSELNCYNETNFRRHHEFHWRRYFGDISFPPLYPISHHYVHAFQACMQSPFDSAVCITIDGSGDQNCTVVWIYKNDEILPIIEIKMPHSLGWFYAAFTEYLGFKAYDGEYKVMGLAAYGRPNAVLRKKLSKVIFPASDNIEYRIDPKFIHYGPRNYSGRFTDFLVELMEQKPRLPDEKITQIVRDYGVEVFPRPAELATDEASTLSVLQHLVENIPCDIVVLLQATSPIRRPGLIDECVKEFNDNDYDSLATGFICDYIEYGKDNMRRQDIEGFFYDDGNIYVIKADLIERGDRYGEKIGKKVISRWENIDIDDEYDFWIAEKILQGNNITEFGFR